VTSLSTRYEIERSQSPLGTKAHCRILNRLRRLRSCLVDDVLLCLRGPYQFCSPMASKIRVIGIFLRTTGCVMLLDGATWRHPFLASSTLALSCLVNRFFCRRSRSPSRRSGYTPASASSARLAGAWALRSGLGLAGIGEPSNFVEVRLYHCQKVRRPVGMLCKPAMSLAAA